MSGCVCMCARAHACGYLSCSLSFSRHNVIPSTKSTHTHLACGSAFRSGPQKNDFQIVGVCWY